MKYKALIILVFALVASFSSCNENEKPVDLEAPVIGALTAGQSIQPSPGMLVGPLEESVMVNFKVTDSSGIKEILLDIHGGFDGHSHGRLSNSFERLNIRQIFSSTASNPNLRIPKGSPEVIIDAHRISWTGSNAAVVGNLLAGPYHITISATDLEGNQSGFADGSNYHTTFYIQRPYAPLLQLVRAENGGLVASAGQNLKIEGSVLVTNDPISTPLKFIWVRLSNQDNLDEKISESTFGEAMVGESSWRNLKGEPLFATDKFDLGSLLAKNSIQIPTGQSKLTLIIWAEDTAGNVTREAIPIHVN
ncbi:hypothetical protein P872_22240 [Rhodonellum psychrophilum GCM71 = DSM 17998]|uniref:DUF4625 domain-containing protein n=2 Tax=Rhodonellum TaxID=336827 RepID=U5BRV1_9BACT|nr:MULTISPECIES: DUF4625 domain-containing protein [Rhodonellum]ERM80249.1 hypothetical protein P872_22240 [Rhodonellum psychrophilum GCM71 = DSM 17998]SDZ22650.1 protein of unknown function [Rhodonellum ikkaensis]